MNATKHHERTYKRPDGHMTVCMVIRPEGWVETVLGSPHQIRLLRVLARDPAKYWTERQAAAEAGLAQSTANQVFRRLTATGLLEVRKAGRSHLVRLHREYGIARRIIGLLREEMATLDKALAKAASRVPKGVAIYLFGSTARGDAKPTSDVDVFVAAPTAEAAEAAAAAIRAEIRRVLPAHVAVIALDQRAAKQPRYQPLLENIRREGRKRTNISLEEVFD